MSSPVADPMSSPAASVEATAPVYSVSFEEFRWGAIYTPGKQEKEYTSYEEVIAAVGDYLTTRCGKFPNERIEIRSSRQIYEYALCELRCRTAAQVKEHLPAMTTDLTNGYTISLHVSLDGTTEYGHAGLHTIRISRPAAIECRREEILAKHGRLHRCRDPDCDFDCGLLRCGCIERCECHYDRDNY